jgi:hypothetical protein
MDDFYWYFSAGAAILLPSNLKVKQPFPILSARADSNLTSLVITITTNSAHRNMSDRMFAGASSKGPRSTGVEIVQNEPVNSPYPGRQLVRQVQAEVTAAGICSIYRVLDIEHSPPARAIFEAQDMGSFEEIRIGWETVLNSFRWDSLTGVALKFDGDETAFHARHIEPPIRVPPPLLTLPAQLAYLQPVVSDLLSLDAQELDESYDIRILQELLKERTKDRSAEEIEATLASDLDALLSWIKADPRRESAYFLVGAINSFLLDLVARRGLQ